jgi:hypothetical protein
MDLETYLQQSMEMPCAWAKRHNICIPSVTRFLKGQRGLASGTMAKIVAASEGKVTFNDLLKGNGSPKQ